MHSVFVSIIIPTYNRAEFISETLDSVLGQRYKKWECIVIDDGSTDNTLSVLDNYAKKDERIKFYSRPDALLKGANSCRNYGFTKSSGDYINWFDDDDIMLSNFISDKVNSLTAHKKDLIISSGYRTNHNLENRSKISLPPLKDTLYKDFVLDRIHVLTPSIMFRKNFLAGNKLFLDVIKKGQENELFSRLFFSLSNDGYELIDSFGYLYRSHPASSSSINASYKKDFKESSAYIVSKNLERALLLNDKELIQSAYRMLLNLYKKALENKHRKNINFIINSIKTHKIKNKVLIINVLVLLRTTYTFVNISFTKWDKIINKISIKL